jgi:hypothetical protein
MSIGPSRWNLTRRALLRRAGALGAAMSVPGLGDLLNASGAEAAVKHGPITRPAPSTSRCRSTTSWW